MTRLGELWCGSLPRLNKYTAQPLHEIACVRVARCPRDGRVYAAEVAATPGLEPGARGPSSMLVVASLVVNRMPAWVPAELLRRQELAAQVCRHPKGKDGRAPLQRAGAGGAHVLGAAAPRRRDVAEGAPQRGEADRPVAEQLRVEVRSGNSAGYRKVLAARHHEARSTQPLGKRLQLVSSARNRVPREEDVRQSELGRAPQGALCDVPVDLSALGQPLKHRHVGLLVVVHEDDLAAHVHREGPVLGHGRVYDAIDRVRERLLRPVEQRCDGIERSAGAAVAGHLVQAVQPTGARFVEHEAPRPFTAPHQ
eukprot:scaffold67472_cov70-Phaeocystis_antarctica.AAC.1